MSQYLWGGDGSGAHAESSAIGESSADALPPHALNVHSYREGIRRKKEKHLRDHERREQYASIGRISPTFANGRVSPTYLSCRVELNAHGGRAESARISPSLISY